MRPSSSRSEPGLFSGVLARGGAAEAVDDEAWLRALLDVEAAIARAAARVGAVDTAAADAVAAVCADASVFDIASLGADAADSGNPVVPLVARIRALAPEEASSSVHFGATSQDALDSALMLVAKRALAVVLDDVRGAADAAAGLADRNRRTVMAGRTLLQQAVPITFGLKAAGWAVALDGACGRLDEVSAALPVQYGGAAGTLAASSGHGLAMLAVLADELGLDEPELPWHSVRLPVADLAGALGATCGVVGKVATDLVLLAQTEVAEVAEGVSGRGGSSTMAHKHNPVAAVSARAAARRAPGLVATLLTSMEAEHERAAGGWHAEWETVTTLLRTTGSAAAWLRDSLENLHVDADRMRANLGPDLVDGTTGEADALVERALARRPAPARPGPS